LQHVIFKSFFVTIAIRQWQLPVQYKTADPNQHGHEAALGKGEVCQLQLLLKRLRHRLRIKI
jgi:hypothetical protein